MRALDGFAAERRLLAAGAFDAPHVVEGIARLGAHNTLVQTVLKLTVPGMPDIYQGTELWDLSLVDPDNRRPVQYGLRMRLLEETEAALDVDRGEAMPRFFRERRNGRFKLAALATLLGLRREFRAVQASASSRLSSASSICPSSFGKSTGFGW